MQLKQLLSDDEAVSPVIGVILMVAITVILAAVIASFVLGLGGQTEVSPTADFSFDFNPDENNVTVTHGGGDNIRASEVYVRGEDLDTDTSQSWGANVSATGHASVSGTIEGESAIVSGDSWVVDVDSDEYVLRVVWESTAGDTSSELAVDRGPNA